MALTVVRLNSQISNYLGSSPYISGASIASSKFTSPYEKLKIIESSPSNQTETGAKVYLNESAINYYTVSPSANFSVDLRMSSSGSATVNSSMAIGDSVTISLIYLSSTSTPGSSLYIDGSLTGVTTYRLNGVSGSQIVYSGSRIVLSYTVIKEADATFKVFMSGSRYS